MADNPRKTVSVHITGRVQGVWFRGWTREQALNLGVNGWIANRADGSVSGVFEGSPDAVDALIAACRDGPPLANVLDMRTEPLAAGGFSDFEVRPTY